MGAFHCDVAKRDKTVHTAPILILTVDLQGDFVQDVDCVENFDDSIFVRHVDHVFHPGLHLGEAAVERIDALVHLLRRFPLFEQCTDVLNRLHGSTSEALDSARVHLQHEYLESRKTPLMVARGVAGLELLQARHLGLQVVQDSAGEELELFLGFPQTCQLVRQGRYSLKRKVLYILEKIKLMFLQNFLYLRIVPLFVSNPSQRIREAMFVASLTE